MPRKPGRIEILKKMMKKTVAFLSKDNTIERSSNRDANAKPVLAEPVLEVTAANTIANATTPQLKGTGPKGAALPTLGNSDRRHPLDVL